MIIRLRDKRNRPVLYKKKKQKSVNRMHEIDSWMLSVFAFPGFQ